MRTYRFYKEECSIETTRKWYIDLKYSPFSKNALEMVAGADDLLDKLSNGKKEVTIQISTKYFKDHTDVLVLRQKLGLFLGAIYSPLKEKLETEIFDHKNLLWLCPVTLWIFLGYPTTIYFKIV